MVAYDTIGATYTATRQPDPRVGALITAALGGARSVINVGAGAGSYGPPQTVLAQPGDAALARGLRRLEADLASGAWHDRHRDLLDRDTFDGGYRLLIADL